jgi:hypothetical protein
MADPAEALDTMEGALAVRCGEPDRQTIMARSSSTTMSNTRPAACSAVSVIPREVGGQGRFRCLEFAVLG